MKKILLLTTILLFAFFVSAQVSKTVNVTTAGTLKTLLTTTEMTTVTNLTVTGIIDAQDFKFIRDGITNLAVLNISGVTIQAYNGTGGTSTTFTSYKANEVPANAFYEKIKLTAIYLSNSVTSIGYYAFVNCMGLTSITIPDSVTSIGGSAFYGCSGFTSFTLPNSVIVIGDDAFNSCSRLTSLTLPNSVTTIGSSAFWYCSRLTSLTIGNSVTWIGYYAFMGCKGLSSLTLPNSVTSIGGSAFSYCSGLTSLYVFATTPIVLQSSVFASVNVYSCTLYVPAGSKSAYQAAPIWGDFNIVEMAPSAIPTLSSESVNIYPNPVTDGFQINGLEGSGTLTLTDISGKTLLTKQVKTNDYVSVSYLPKGIYIARITTANGIIERKLSKF